MSMDHARLSLSQQLNDANYRNVFVYIEVRENSQVAKNGESIEVSKQSDVHLIMLKVH
jgi:hypothetical protein